MARPSFPVRQFRAIRKTVFRAVFPQLVHYLKYAAFTDAIADDLAAWKPDVIHAHDLHTLPTGAELARRAGAALIYDSHELETHRQPPPPLLRRRFTAWLEKRGIAKADAVITVGDAIADHLRELYSIERPTVVRNAPSDVGSSNLGRAGSIRTCLGVHDDVPIAVYVGLVTLNRGVEVAIRALPLLENVVLATVGPIREETGEDLLELARKLGVAHRFRMLPAVPPEDVVGFIADADVGLIPILPVTLSYRYAMPNKLFEMAFAGLPLVASDLPEIRRFIERYDLGEIFAPGDHVEMAKRTKTVLEGSAPPRPRPESLGRLRGENAWSVQCAALEGVYRRVRTNATGPINRSGDAPAVLP